MSFVAVEVDETSDATNKALTSVALRYVAKRQAACEVSEAFVGFDDVSDDRRASTCFFIMASWHTGTFSV